MVESTGMLLDDITSLLELAEISHGCCRLESDDYCHATQYGDGVAQEHAILRRVRSWIDGRRRVTPW